MLLSIVFGEDKARKYIILDMVIEQCHYFKIVLRLWSKVTASGVFGKKGL